LQGEPRSIKDEGPVMKSKRLVLIHPANHQRLGLGNVPMLRYPPLALAMVAAATPDNWEVEIIDEVREPFRYREADLVGLTGTTNAAPRAYEIAAEYRRQKVPVVMGGSHASVCPDEALRFVDSVVIGEAEPVWPQVLEHALRGRLEPIYRSEPGPLSGLPRPRRELFKYKVSIATVQTSRGCPMDCHFCSVSALHGCRYRRRPVEEILDELATIRQRRLCFLDDNLVGYGAQDRQEALDLFQGMVRRGFRFHWACQASLNVADDEELLAWAARAGCRVIFIGIEADDPDALAEMNKRVNLKRGAEQYGPLLRRIHRAGIIVLGSFMFGLDCDTPDSLRRRAEYILASNVDVAQASVLTPCPGTRVFEKMRQEGRLLLTDFPRDWQRYDGIELVFQPLHFSHQELMHILCDFTTRYCRWSTFSRKVLRTFGESRKFVAAGTAAWLNLSYRRLRLGALRVRQASVAGPSARIAVDPRRSNGAMRHATDTAVPDGAAPSPPAVP
jgi:radical SAM superfamily enzyme YgiQ (UPF0313 family)